MTSPDDGFAQHTDRDAPSGSDPVADDTRPEGEGAEAQVVADRDLLEALRAGDDTAWAELQARHRRTALNVARMHTRNVQDAEELAAAVFAQLLGVLRRGGGPQCFLRAWLVAAVGRLAVDQAQEQSGARHPLEPADGLAGPGRARDIDGLDDLDDLVVGQCEAVAVVAAYSSLPEAWQAVLWHTEVEAMTPVAAARQLGISADAVPALAERAGEGLGGACARVQEDAPSTEGCSVCASSLGAFVGGSLAPRPRSEVQKHLDGCPRCTAEYLRLQGGGVGLRTWLLPVLAALPMWGTEAKVLAAILASGTGAVEAAADPGASGEAEGCRAVSADGAAGTAARLPDGARAEADLEADGAGEDPRGTGSAVAGPVGSDPEAPARGVTLAPGVVAGSIGLKVAVGAVAAAATVSLIGLGLTTLVQGDDANRSTTLGGLPFPAGEGGSPVSRSDVIRDDTGAQAPEPQLDLGVDPGADPGESAGSTPFAQDGSTAPQTPSGPPSAGDLPAASPTPLGDDGLSAFGDDSTGGDLAAGGQSANGADDGFSIAGGGSGGRADGADGEAVGPEFPAVPVAPAPSTGGATEPGDPMTTAPGQGGGAAPSTPPPPTTTPPPAPEPPPTTTPPPAPEPESESGEPPGSTEGDGATEADPEGGAGDGASSDSSDSSDQSDPSDPSDQSGPSSLTAPDGPGAADRTPQSVSPGPVQEQSPAPEQSSAPSDPVEQPGPTEQSEPTQPTEGASLEPSDEPRPSPTEQPSPAPSTGASGG